MKAHELYTIWSQFEQMMESSLADDKKLQMGAEWVRSLPPEQLCVSAQLSYRIVKEAMQGRLTDLKEKHGSTQGKAEEPRREEQEQGDNGRPKPIRKAKQNA
jgi:hypothetical protein